MDDAVQNIIADVGCGTFHALHVNLTLGHVEIVVQELPSVFCLPEKIFGDISPELWTQRDKQMLIQNSEPQTNSLPINGTSKLLYYKNKKSFQNVFKNEKHPQ